MGTLREALEVCESEGDLLGLARTCFVLVTAEGRMRGRFDAAADASRRAVDYFARYGASGVADALHADALADSSAPITDAIRFCEAVLERENVPLELEGGILVQLAWSTAHTARIEESLELLDRARARFIDVGDEVAVETVVALCGAHVDLLGRDFERVNASARAGLDAAMERSDRIWTTHFNGVLADAAVLEREYERALELAERARETATETDVHQALGWRGPRARALAGLALFDDAELCAREMSDIADEAGYLLGRGEARLALGGVLAGMDRLEDAVAVTEEALVLLEAKGARLLADRAQAQITALRGGEPEVRAPLRST